MSKEVMLIIAAILFVIVALYTIGIIGKLKVPAGQKRTLYWITVIIPVLGLYLALRTKDK